MQILIDISKEEYNLIKMKLESNIGGVLSEAERIIANGTPLPKHGRLIDGDALEKLCYEHEIGNSIFDGEPIIAKGQYDDGDNIWKSLFDFAPTIIEAYTPSMHYSQVEENTPTVISSNGSDMLSAEEIDNLLQALAEGE